MDKHTEEIEAVESIFPELEKLDDNVFLLDINIVTENEVSVSFITSGETHRVGHLPPVMLRMTLSEEYPENVAPNVEISACWLDSKDVEGLEKQLKELWDHDMVLFDMIDYCKNSLEQTTHLNLNESLKPTILSFEQSSIKHEFDTYPFLCQICQSRKRGELCTKLVNCGDVFCTECLTDYYSACIQQGYVNQVICPEPNCKNPGVSEDFDLKKLLGDQQIKRLKEIKRKLAIEKDPNTAVICPRSCCEALIRRNPDDNLTICEDCGLAFCGICLRSWHGYFEFCRIQEPSLDVLEEYVNGDAKTRRRIETSWGKINMLQFEKSYMADKAFKEYMENSDNRACPTCYSPIEKSTGCNKMTCAICHTFFCFLCGKILNRMTNPYDHFNQKGTNCFQKLFEGIDVNQLNEELGAIAFD